MNFKSILVVGLSIATLGLSLPAHADTATVVNSDQSVVVTGDKNITGQENTTRVNNRETGRRNVSDTGSSVSNVQSADILGEKNITGQSNRTVINNTRNRR